MTERTAAREVSVLIVGGGPAGLTMAMELARRGVDGLLVERRGFTSHFPRAHLLNVRTMETFHDVGAAEEIYQLSPPEGQWRRVAWYTSLSGPTPLHGLKIGQVQAWGGGTDRARYELASPRPFANLPQIRLDALLWRHADRAWPGNIRAHTELTALTIDDSGVLATVRDLADGGETYQVRARFCVAADGGRTCSDLVGVTMAGPRSLVDKCSVYFSADLSKYADPEALITYFVSPAGQGSVAGGLLALGPDTWGAQSREWLISMSFPVGHTPSKDRDFLIQRARDMIGVADLDMDIHSVSHWQYEGVVAERFRAGPVFLVGDAAHRHPPTGGLGLNTAIGDVSNLAWKLAAVLKGYAGDTLLDSYEPERLPVAARNVEHSLLNAGRHAPIASAMGLARGMPEEQGWRETGIWASDSPEGAERRAASDRAVAANAEDYSQLNIEAGFAYEAGAVIPDGSPPLPSQDSATEFAPTSRPGHHIPHSWLQSADGKVSTVDLVAAEGFTLFVDGQHGERWQAAAASAAGRYGCPLRVVVIGPGAPVDDPSGAWAQVRGVGASGAILVRPDRHVAWRVQEAPSEPAREIGRVLDRLLHEEADIATTAQAIAPHIAAITAAGRALGTPGQAPARLFTVDDQR